MFWYAYWYGPTCIYIVVDWNTHTVYTYGRIHSIVLYRYVRIHVPTEVLGRYVLCLGRYIGRAHSATAQQRVRWAPQARTWPAFAFTCTQNRHRRPSRDTGSAKQLPTPYSSSRAPRKLSPSGLRAHPRLFTSVADHRPPPRAPPAIWTSAPGWGAIIDSLRANRRRERIG